MPWETAIDWIQITFFIFWETNFVKIILNLQVKCQIKMIIYDNLYSITFRMLHTVCYILYVWTGLNAKQFEYYSVIPVEIKKNKKRGNFLRNMQIKLSLFSTDLITSMESYYRF